MADDLGSDWWKDDSDDNADETKRDEESEESLQEMHSANDSQGDTKNEADEVKRKEDKAVETSKKKRKRLPGGTKHTAEAEDQKVKRPKKRRITKVKLDDAPAASPDEFRNSLAEYYKGKLTAVEMDALSVPDEKFRLTNEDRSYTIASFLKQALPKWQRLRDSFKQKMSPLVLVLCCNANRALDFNREAGAFKGDKCKTAKLFARHMKTNEQAKFLKSNVVHFSVGTPSRVEALIAEENEVHIRNVYVYRYHVKPVKVQ